MATNKNRKNKPYNVYNKIIIKRLIEKHGFTPHFIYASLRGDRVSESSAKIVEDYKLMLREVNKTLNKL